MEFFKAIDTTKGIINSGAYLAYHTTDGQTSYGKMIQGVRLKGAAGHQDVCQVFQMLPCTPMRYDHFNCSVIKMTDNILFIPIEKIILRKVCIQHCCEYTTCRMLRGKYQHEPLYRYYRVNRFFLSEDL
ncbi:uncharacterized protein [Ptychodera flava]|uniref:uncharacterized protein n=1 Tax=Ptychodera flava TaxID=63121 RepID=UPI003969D4B9